MDLIGNATENVARSINGNVQKAVLFVRNPESGLYAGDSSGPKAGENTELTTGEIGAIEDIDTLHKKLMEKADQALKKKKTLGFDDMGSYAKDNKYIALQVQYNPASIRFDTTAGRQMDYGGNGGNTTLQQFIAPASTTLSCELLFDDVNNMDAFMLSDSPITGSLSPGQLYQFGKSVVSNLTNQEYSIQDQIEGLVSLMAVPEAKQVIFFWGNMSFRGEMVQVNAAYTMFNKKGAPIRGKVGISIRQGDSDKADEKEYKYDKSYWDNAFKKMFSEDRGKTSAFTKATNNNLLNLNI